MYQKEVNRKGSGELPERASSGGMITEVHLIHVYHIHYGYLLVLKTHVTYYPEKC